MNPVVQRSNTVETSPRLRSTFLNLYADVFWYGVFAGSILVFLSIYAARLGASAFQVGLISSGPALINLLFSLQAARWLEGRSLTGAVYGSAILYRLVYFGFFPLAWFFGNTEQIHLIILLCLMGALPGTLIAIAFNSMFAQVVPSGWRAHVVGWRTALISLAQTGTTLGCGLILDQVRDPLNYQIVFFIGAMGGAMSTLHLKRVHDLYSHQGLGVAGFLRRWRAELLRAAAAFRLSGGPHGKPLLRLDLIRGTFGRFLASYLLFYTCQFVPIPIFPLFFVRELRLTDGEIGLGQVLFNLGMLVGSTLVARLSYRYGHRRVLYVAGALYGVYPLVLAFATDITLYVVASGVGGVIWAIASGAVVNRLMERVPSGDRPAYMALHNVVLNLGILLGSTVGPLLGGLTGLREAILIGAGLRFLAALLLRAWA